MLYSYKRTRRCKGLIREVQPLLPQYPFVARFDVAAFYDSIVHAILLAQLAQAGAPQDLQDLVRQYLQEPDATGSGIVLCVGGSRSPLLAALYLLPLDLAFQNSDTEGSIFYRRFMDDFVILAKTRRQLRTAVRRVHTELAALGLVVHKKKWFIGRTTTGFDILGYTLHPLRRLRPSAGSLRRMKERTRRLYEQGASVMRLWQYVTRWCDW